MVDSPSLAQPLAGPSGLQCSTAAAGGAAASRTRPSAAALDYVRCQRGTVLVAAASVEDSWLTGAGSTGPAEPAPCNGPQQQQQQQLRPMTVGPQQASASMQQKLRPASAGPYPAKPRAWSAQHRGRAFAPSSSRPCSGQRQPPRATASSSMGQQHRCGTAAGRRLKDQGRTDSSSSSRGCVLGPVELQRFSSTGLAARVKGGSFSTCSREGGASASGASSAAAGTELLYEPKPEAQGHMHRSPGWSLPPNRVETSKKWARLAAQATLQ